MDFVEPLPREANKISRAHLNSLEPHRNALRDDIIRTEERLFLLLYLHRSTWRKEPKFLNPFQ